jgi:hypothetical protein
MMFRRSLAAILFAIALAAMLSTTARAEDFDVISFEDSADSDLNDNECASNLVEAPCTLRAAIQQANFTPGHDRIILRAGTYELTIDDQDPFPDDEDAAATGDLDITSNLTINGAGANRTTITGDEDWERRIFHLIDPGAVALISGVTIQGGNVPQNGGGILNTNGTLELRNCRLFDNFAGNFGGGIANNTSDERSLTIDSCLIDQNRAGDDAGDNSRGGGVHNGQNSTLVIVNSTIYSNVAASRGGGIDISNNGDTATLNNVTIFGNKLLDDEPDGAGVFLGNGMTIDVYNSIIAGNRADNGGGVGDDCDGQFTSLRYSLIQTFDVDPQQCFLIEANAEGNRLDEEPQLGPLADNGGQTPTLALAGNSPALSAGNPAEPGSSGDDVCEIDDQRGFRRIGRCDMGAFERIVMIFSPLIENN